MAGDDSTDQRSEDNEPQDSQGNDEQGNNAPVDRQQPPEAGNKSGRGVVKNRDGQNILAAGRRLGSGGINNKVAKKPVFVDGVWLHLGREQDQSGMLQPRPTPDMDAYIRNHQSFTTHNVVDGVNVTTHQGTSETLHSLTYKMKHYNPAMPVSAVVVGRRASGFERLGSNFTKALRGCKNRSIRRKALTSTAAGDDVDMGGTSHVAVCANCRRSGHTLAHCAGPVKRGKGDIVGCCVHNTLEHNYDECPEFASGDGSLAIHLKWLVSNRRGLPLIRSDRISVWLLVMGFPEQEGYPLSERFAHEESEKEGSVLFGSNFLDLSYTNGACQLGLVDAKTASLRAIGQNVNFHVPITVWAGYIKKNLFAQDFVASTNFAKIVNADDNLDPEYKTMVITVVSCVERKQELTRVAVRRITQQRIEEFSADADWGTKLHLFLADYQPQGHELANQVLVAFAARQAGDTEVTPKDEESDEENVSAVLSNVNLEQQDSAMASTNTDSKALIKEKQVLTHFRK
ncbi:hypothetical protein ColTof4_11455 [Colletotrichum tofieldiae]|nr:hypothetical protein ColTof3_04644 [Colletotrichum tofieldiae]GKT79032.1 hypothetical protein ColTof4_11455 [Colletotrichum tofieldiae]